MRRLLFSIAFIIAGFVSCEFGMATPYEFTSAIHRLRVHDSGIGALDWVQFTDVSSAGGCATWLNRVIISIKSDEGGKRQIAALLEAKATGKRLLFGVDDAYMAANGYCYLRYVDVIE